MYFLNLNEWLGHIAYGRTVRMGFPPIRMPRSCRVKIGAAVASSSDRAMCIDVKYRKCSDCVRIMGE